MSERRDLISNSPDETFQIGESVGRDLRGGEIILLTGGLGAGKTLFTKGVLNALDFDVDEVTSPSFTLVNLYPTSAFNVYHIDLWRTGDSEDPAFAVGLDEMLENERAVVIIEWAEKLKNRRFDSPVISISISGDGDEPRTIEIETLEQSGPVAV
jgi:tRNA threonylcarbamoyladenosine biosynthesis protein TsaE